MLQSTGAPNFIKKPIEQMEQMPDDTPKGEEKGNTDSKNEKDKISGHECFEIGFMLSLHCHLENKQFYPSGVYTKPFLPPRY